MGKCFIGTIIEVILSLMVTTFADYELDIVCREIILPLLFRKDQVPATYPAYFFGKTLEILNIFLKL